MKTAQEVIDAETSKAERRAGIVVFVTWPDGGGVSDVDVAYNGPEGLDLQMAEMLVDAIKRRRRTA